MRITNLPAYQHIYQKFESGEFKPGIASELPVYTYDVNETDNLTVGHYVGGINYSKIHLEDVPESFQTRDFFLHVVSSVHKDVLAYVKENLGKKFNRNFFKDHIATEHYSLSFEENCFEYMPLEYIDEEMVSWAMIKAIDSRCIDRRGDFEDWFYSVAKRKPEVLTQDFWTLGARIFAKRMYGKNKFLEITPDKYKTKEYYFAMCLENSTTIMEDFPKDVLSPEFLIALINDNINNIKSFSEEALEQEVPVIGLDSPLKIWKAVLMIDGFNISNITLNDERTDFFLNRYDENSSEYRIAFNERYQQYLRSKKENEA